MQEIGSGINYRVVIDKTRNRLFVWFMGDIISLKGVQGIVHATKSACNALTPGFTALVDFTEMDLLGVPDIIQELQETVMAGGLRKLASVWSPDAFAKLAVNSSAYKVAGGAYEQKRKVFHSGDEAEAWLDA